MKYSHSRLRLLVLYATLQIGFSTGISLARDPNAPVPPPLPYMSYVDGDFYNGTGIVTAGAECMEYYDAYFCKTDGRVCLVTLDSFEGYHVDTHSLTAWVHVSGFIRSTSSFCFVPRLESSTIDPLNHCDFNNDYKVDFVDYAYLLQAWYSSCSYLNIPSGAAWCHGRDVNRDGKVDAADMREFAENWLIKQFWSE